MPYRRRIGAQGFVFHVLNRGVRRARLFDRDGDYLDAVRLLADARHRTPLGILAYCLMPNHFHLVALPTADGQLSAFMHWFTATHSKRWHVWRGTTGTGSVYQGRFKALPVQTDSHFLTVCRYVERNALRAGLVARAEEWPWSSLSQRVKNCHPIPLEPWPIPQPENWVELVNGPEVSSDVSQMRRAIVRNGPYGSADWVKNAANALGVESSLRRLGRPRKTTSGVVLRKT